MLALCPFRTALSNCPVPFSLLQQDLGSTNPANSDLVNQDPDPPAAPAAFPQAGRQHSWHPSCLYPGALAPIYPRCYLAQHPPPTPYRMQANEAAPPQTPGQSCKPVCRNTLARRPGRPSCCYGLTPALGPDTNRASLRGHVPRQSLRCICAPPDNRYPVGNLLDRRRL